MRGAQHDPCLCQLRTQTGSEEKEQAGNYGRREKVPPGPPRSSAAKLELHRAERGGQHVMLPAPPLPLLMGKHNHFTPEKIQLGKKPVEKEE